MKSDNVRMSADFALVVGTSEPKLPASILPDNKIDM